MTEKTIRSSPNKLPDKGLFILEGIQLGLQEGLNNDPGEHTVTV